jgi:PAS domain S-box-containing protein
MKSSHQAPRATPRTRSLLRPDEKPTQEELAAALLSLGDGVIITGSCWERGGLKVLFANPAFCTMTGYAPGDLIGQNSRRLNGPKSDPARLQRWLRAVRHGRVHHGEGYLYRKEGTLFYAVWSYSPVGEGAGRPERLVAVYRDMTEMRRLQDTLVHSQRLDAVGQLAGGVAHDFNNLLSVINGYCDILNERFAVDPIARRNLEEIHTAGRKAVALTRQLLAFSRRQEMAPKVINLNHVLNELAGSRDQPIPSRSILPPTSGIRTPTPPSFNKSSSTSSSTPATPCLSPVESLRSAPPEPPCQLKHPPTPASIFLPAAT